MGDESNVWAVAERVLSAARAVRAAFPGVDAMRAVAMPDVPPVAAFGPGGAAVNAALRYVRDEVKELSTGRPREVHVLDDEIAHAEHVLSETRGRPADTASSDHCSVH